MPLQWTALEAVKRLALPKEGFDVIPMWVADMNFPTVPSIQEAVIERVKHPAFGYFVRSGKKDLIDHPVAEDRNGVTGLKPEHIGYENGVLGGVSSALTDFASPGDHGARSCTRHILDLRKRIEQQRVHDHVHSDLKKDEQGIWRMDYEDMDRKIKGPTTSTVASLLLSPHNPCGQSLGALGD